MILQLIIAFFLIIHLRKSFKTADNFPEWDKIFKGIMIACIVLQVMYYSFLPLKPLIKFLSILLVFGVVGIIYLQKVFEQARPTIFAVLPLILLSFVEYVVKLISISFYKNWDNVFDVGEIFAFIWMGTMLIINNRQRKALERERHKTQEEERQNKIMASLKAELEVQVAERTAALTLQTEELQHALDELKATQKQLIQSEKMASLGELTAGIAHEIQNPLNFVNNFSEVSNELIEELKDERQKIEGERNTALENELLNDIKQNLEKILHHGKRADAIVKGMLQHSRSTNNATKEPTNINALADEYLRLAYHGLRAKDKSFNATLNTDFDESIGDINIIPQDIGRVILNLITNAFYATSLPIPQGEILAPAKNNSPTVWVKTSKIYPSLGRGAEVLISVRDNGPGIPSKLLDKIFQPFFTTKPTGQGTGLGLSLSYDIVKAHGGELKVETQEGKGCEFIIKLPV